MEVQKGLPKRKTRARENGRKPNRVPPRLMSSGWAQVHADLRRALPELGLPTPRLPWDTALHFHYPGDTHANGHLMQFGPLASLPVTYSLGPFGCFSSLRKNSFLHSCDIPNAKASVQSKQTCQRQTELSRIPGLARAASS